jgi:Xaa-Pro aminopeptidase
VGEENRRTVVTTYAWPAIDWDDLRRRRRDRFVEVMRDKHLDHVLVSGFDNLRWVTDYRTNLTYDSNLDWFAALVDEDAVSVLFVPDALEDENEPLPDFPWIKKRVAGPSWESFWTHVNVYSRLLVRELHRARAKRVGVELLHFEIMDTLRREMPDIEWVPVTWDLLEMRKLKMPDEVRLLEAASEVGSLCMSAVIERAEEGMTDYDLTAIACDTAYRNGAEWVSHAALVAQGAGKEVNWLPRGRRIWSGESFILDFGVYGFGGYCHDFCRTHFIGEPRLEAVCGYRALVASFAEGVAIARPGVKCSEITNTINGALVRHGFPATGYAMGHGIGLRLIELPSISKPQLMEQDDTLAEGMVICIEPSTSVQVDGTTVALKEEEVFVVESSGLRQLTKTRRART